MADVKVMQVAHGLCRLSGPSPGAGFWHRSVILYVPKTTQGTVISILPNFDAFATKKSSHNRFKFVSK